MCFQPSFAFAADLHLRPQTWAKHPDLRGDAYMSLAAIRDYCLQGKLPLVLGGDIFNSRRPDPFSVREFANTTNRLDVNAVGSYFIQGNHDFCSHVPWPGVTNAPNHLHQREWLIGDIRVCGLDWTPRDSLPVELARIPESTEVLVCHQAWDELQGIGNTDGSINSIPDHVRILLTGDYHVHLRNVFTRQSGAPLCVCSPGSTHLYKIDESPDKSFFVVGHNDRGEIVVASIPIPTRRLFVRTIRTSEELVAFASGSACADAYRGCEALPEEIRKPIFRLEFHDDVPDAYNVLRAAVGEYGHFFPAPIHVAEEVVVDLGEDSETFDTLRGSIQRMEDDETVVAGIFRLLDAEDPAKELEAMLQEHLDAAASAPG